MKRLVFIIVANILIFKGFSQNISEILGRPTNSSITTNILSDSQINIYIEYWEDKASSAINSQIITCNANSTVEIKLDGLKHNTRYLYRSHFKRIADPNYIIGETHTFTTQRAKGETFNFTIEADPHPYDKKGCWPLWDIALSNQLKDTADFIIDLGDTFGDDHNPTTITSDQVKQLQLNGRGFFSKVCHSMPLLFCIGNHEGESGYYLLQNPPNNLATYETLWRKTFFSNPYPDGFYSGNNASESFGMGQPHNYYAWEWGDALFVVLDMYRYASATEKPQKWDWTIGKTQYDWFKSTLENSSAKYKFVFGHHILGQGRGGIELATSFEWGGYDAGTYKFDAYRPGWGLPIHDLMKANNVSIFFQGHDHIFVQQELDNIIYQTVPMPSDSSYMIGMNDNGDAFLSGTKLSGSGHLRVTVSPDNVSVAFVKAILPQHETTNSKNGDVAFTYSSNGSNTTSIDEVTNSKPLIGCYPNPFTNRINVSNCNGNETFELYNIIGKTIWTGNQIEQQDFSILPKGIYFLRVNNSLSTQALKLIKM